MIVNKIVTCTPTTEYAAFNGIVHTAIHRTPPDDDGKKKLFESLEKLLEETIKEAFEKGRKYEREFKAANP